MRPFDGASGVELGQVEGSSGWERSELDYMERKAGASHTHLRHCIGHY